MVKYNVQVQVTTIKFLKKIKKNLFVKGTFKEEDKICKCDLVTTNEARSSDNCLVSTLLKPTLNQKEEVTITICTEKKTLGCIVFDIHEYVTRVSNGRGDFNLSPTIEKKGITIELLITITKEEKKERRRNTLEDKPIAKSSKPLRRKETSENAYKSPLKHRIIKEEEENEEGKKKDKKISSD